MFDPTTQNKTEDSPRFKEMKPENLNVLGLKMNLEDWEKVYSEWDVDDKVSVFNSIVICMLDEALPVRTVRAHCTDKPWMTPNIKALIKARQRAFTKGATPKYKSLHAKVKLISNAKATYYKSKAEGSHQSNPAKWYKTIYRLAAATENQQSLSSPDHADLMEIADRLQRSFTKPWLGIQPDLPRLHAVEHLLKDSHSPLPSIGQVKTVLKHLNPRKATGSDNIPAWCLKRY
jgi:hypothetical protein